MSTKSNQINNNILQTMLTAIVVSSHGQYGQVIIIIIVCNTID